jgi:hypothetical protein
VESQREKEGTSGYHPTHLPQRGAYIHTAQPILSTAFHPALLLSQHNLPSSDSMVTSTREWRDGWDLTFTFCGEAAILFHDFARYYFQIGNKSTSRSPSYHYSLSTAMPHCADQFVYRASTFSHRRPMSITGIGYPQVLGLGSASNTLIRSRVVATLACVGMHDGRLGIEISISHPELHLVLPAGTQLKLSAFSRPTFTQLDGASVKQDSGAHRACRTDRDLGRVPQTVTCRPLRSDTQSVGQWQRLLSPP